MVWAVGAEFNLAVAADGFAHAAVDLGGAPDGPSDRAGPQMRALVEAVSVEQNLVRLSLPLAAFTAVYC